MYSTCLRRIPGTLRYMYVLRYVSDVSYYDLCMCHVRDKRARPPRRKGEVESEGAGAGVRKKLQFFDLFLFY